jgi:hypothetical protein
MVLQPFCPHVSAALQSQGRWQDISTACTSHVCQHKAVRTCSKGSAQHGRFVRERATLLNTTCKRTLLI